MIATIPICTNYPTAFTLYYCYSHGWITCYTWRTNYCAYVSTWISSVEYRSPKMPPWKVMFMFIKTPGWLFTIWKSAYKNQNQTTTETNVLCSTEILKIKGFMPSSVLFWFFPKDMQNKWWEGGTFSYIPVKSKRKQDRSDPNQLI